MSTPVAAQLGAAQATATQLRAELHRRDELGAREAEALDVERAAAQETSARLQATAAELANSEEARRQAQRALEVAEADAASRVAELTELADEVRSRASSDLEPQAPLLPLPCFHCFACAAPSAPATRTRCHGAPRTPGPRPAPCLLPAPRPRVPCMQVLAQKSEAEAAVGEAAVLRSELERLQGQRWQASQHAEALCESRLAQVWVHVSSAGAHVPRVVHCLALHTAVPLHSAPPPPLPCLSGCRAPPAPPSSSIHRWRAAGLQRKSRRTRRRGG